MGIATYDDANLLLRLYEIRREQRMRAAREWFAKSARFETLEDLKRACPPGSADNASFRMVTSYWEMVSSFITSGVLNPELFFQANREVVVVYIRMRDLLPAFREDFRDPSAFRNLEQVGQMYIEWMNRQGPEVFEAFSKRMG